MKNSCNLVKKMKSLQFKSYGGCDKLEFTKVEIPKLKNPKDILVSVRAVAVNPVDINILSGNYQKIFNLNLPSGVGFDVCGVVTQVGEEVTKFKKWGFNILKKSKLW